MKIRKAAHKLRMIQRRNDQKNRTRNPLIEAKDYTEYHKNQRSQLQDAIKRMKRIYS